MWANPYIKRGQIIGAPSHKRKYGEISDPYVEGPQLQYPPFEGSSAGLSTASDSQYDYALSQSNYDNGSVDLMNQWPSQAQLAYGAQAAMNRPGGQANQYMGGYGNMDPYQGYYAGYPNPYWESTDDRRTERDSYDLAMEAFQYKNQTSIGRPGVMRRPEYDNAYNSGRNQFENMGSPDSWRTDADWEGLASQGGSLIDYPPRGRTKQRDYEKQPVDRFGYPERGGDLMPVYGCGHGYENYVFGDEP